MQHASASIEVRSGCPRGIAVATGVVTVRVFVGKRGIVAAWDAMFDAGQAGPFNPVVRQVRFMEKAEGAAEAELPA